MSKKKKSFKNRLIGVNKNEVDRYIDYVKKNTEEKIDEKINKIKELEKNNADLKEKINNLKNEMASKIQSKEMMEFAIEKAQEWAEILLENADKRVAEIEGLGREQETLINKKIEAYNTILKNSKEKLNNLLNSEIQKNIELIEELDKFVSNENKNVNKIRDKKINNIIHYDDIKGERDSKKDDGENKQGSNENIEEVSVSTQSVVNENSLNSVPRSLILEKDLGVDEKTKFDKDTTNEKIKDAREVNEEENSNGDIDNLLRNVINFDRLNDEEIKVTLEEKNALIEDQPFDDSVTEKGFWGEDFDDILFEPSGIEKEYGNDNEIKPLDKKSQHEDASDASIEKRNQSSNVIDGEIQNIRRKYIVGKVAGEDLLDREGNFIIKKNEIITIETVQLAEKEGKLANLIVNMKLPEGS